MGGGKFLQSKMVIKTGALAPAGALGRGGGCLMPPSEVRAFFEIVVLNEVIWWTFFHHVKHLTVCLGVSFTSEQDSQKSGGAMPPV